MKLQQFYVSKMKGKKELSVGLAIGIALFGAEAVKEILKEILKSLNIIPDVGITTISYLIAFLFIVFLFIKLQNK